MPQSSAACPLSSVPAEFRRVPATFLPISHRVLPGSAAVSVDVASVADATAVRQRAKRRATVGLSQMLPDGVLRTGCGVWSAEIGAEDQARRAENKVRRME